MTGELCKPEINVAATRYSGVVHNKFNVQRAESAVTTTVTVTDVWD
jgi:hypothetical protein